MSAAEMAFAEQGRVVSAYTFAEKASIQKVIAYIDHTIFCCVKSNSQVYTMTGTTSGVVNIQAQMEPIIGGETIDVTSDVAGFLNKMAAKMQGIEGSIYFYDQLSPWCENVMDAIARYMKMIMFSSSSGRPFQIFWHSMLLDIVHRLYRRIELWKVRFIITCQRVVV